MLVGLLRPFHFVAEAVTAETTSRRIAYGFALGAMIGLIPKDNLLVLGLVLLLFALPVNILAGLLSAAVFSVLGTVLTPFLDHMGYVLLTIIPLQGLYERMMDSPFGLWTRFNNTVVAGGFLVGLLQFWPLYWTMRAFLGRRDAASNEHVISNVMDADWKTERRAA